MAFFYVITYFILLYIILFDFFYETKNKQTNKLTLEVRQVCQNYAAAAAKSLQSCPTLQPHRRQPTRLPSLGFSRQEHWSGLPFPSPVHESETWKWSRSVVSDSATPWTAAHQAPPSTGFSRQEYWSGVPLPSLIVKNLPVNAGDMEMQVWSLGQENPLEEGMATHPSTLAWRIPWTEEPGRL